MFDFINKLELFKETKEPKQDNLNNPIPEKPEEIEKEKDKKIKNLISLVILISGFFIGSLFMDISQLFNGGGFSLKNLSKTDIFESNGKTWVAYADPLIKVQVVTDDQCEKCDPAEPLVWLRRVTPTINAQKVAFDSEEGRNLIEKFGLKTLPAFIFSQSIDKTEFFAQAETLFVPKDGQFELKIQELGLTPGRYLELPKIEEGTPIFGSQESRVVMIVFADFQCPYSKLFQQTLRDAMKIYGDRVIFGFKHLPLSFHAQAEPAALASQCANEQGKFWEYGDKLFATQAEWSAVSGTQKFKDYARTLGLKTAEFNQCLDDKKYQSRIDADKAEAEGFGISGTPASFINSQFNSGVMTLEQVKTILNQELTR
jgi:protein-disulfide isomerase